MDFVYNHPAASTLEIDEVILHSFDCRDYAITTYDNHYYGTQTKYHNNDVADSIVFYDEGQTHSTEQSFIDAGYIKIDQYEPTCVIVYNLHFAVSINGIITAKYSTGELLEHSSINNVYICGEIPAAYYKRP